MWLQNDLKEWKTYWNLKEKHYSILWGNLLWKWLWACRETGCDINKSTSLKFNPCKLLLPLSESNIRWLFNGAIFILAALKR